ncbi:MAG: hypothetical protein HY820_07165 [Acidobacteria bacterium]|nr:hypothetical protein [Acidobacteriota bacterium]
MIRRTALMAVAGGLLRGQSGQDLRYRTYSIRSEHQLYDNVLRVYAPAQHEKKVLYVLPVNADVSYRWGDGFETALRLRLGERHGMVIVAPSFTHWPWYADHPHNAKIRQERYFLSDVVPVVDRLFPGAKRLLVGFSKSGNGGMTLLLRHPQLFHAAAVWDAPLMKTAPDQFGMNEIFGDKAGFAPYTIPRLLEQKAAGFRGGAKRIALLGYDAFAEHMKQAHEAMQRLEIPHHYDNSTWRAHRWDSGWLEEAVRLLGEMS